MSDLLEGAAPNPGEEAGESARPRRVVPLVALAAAVVVGLLVVVAAVVKGGSKDTADTPLLGRPAPVVETTTIDGRPFELASRRGSWVVLNFFSTWCQPCVEEHPELLRFAQAQAADTDGAELYSVIFNDDAGEVERFFAEQGGDWPKLTDPDGQVQVAFGVAKSPETWIIDPAGIVQARIISTVTSDSLDALLQQLKTGVVPAS